MKITFAYLPEEQEEAAAGVAALRQLHPRLKVRKSDAHGSGGSCRFYFPCGAVMGQCLPAGDGAANPVHSFLLPVYRGRSCGPIFSLPRR